MATSDRNRFGAVVGYVREKGTLARSVTVGLPLAFLVVFFVFPLLSIVVLSFLEGMPPAAPTLEHYERIFSVGGLYLGVLQRTLTITVVSTLLVTVLGYSFAYSIVRFSRWTSALLLLVIIPFWINYIVRMYAWINILQDGGVVNWLERAVGLTAGSTGYLYTFEAVIVGFVYIWLPLASLPFYASIRGMDTNLIDASKDLGAGPITTFFKVTLPMTKSGLLAGTTLVAIPTFGSFITPSLLGGTDEVMVGMVIELQFNQAFNWPLGAALSVVVTAVVILFIGLARLLGGDVLASRGVE